MNYSEYHKDWKDIIRPSILKRDKYSCQHCYIKHKSIVYKNSRGNYHVLDEFTEVWAKSQGYKVFTIYLNVCHLDSDKSNNSGDNLISLCPKCHSKHDAAHKRSLRSVLLKSNKGKSNLHLEREKSSITQIVDKIEGLYSFVGSGRLKRNELRQIVSVTLKHK